MTDYERQHSITQCRIEARRLLKQLRSGAPDEVASAVARFRKLQSFSSTSLGDISHLLERVRLKHSLAVVAQERGFESWGAERRSRAGAADGNAGSRLHATRRVCRARGQGARSPVPRPGSRHNHHASRASYLAYLPGRDRCGPAPQGVVLRRAFLSVGRN